MVIDIWPHLPLLRVSVSSILFSLGFIALDFSHFKILQ